MLVSHWFDDWFKKTRATFSTNQNLTLDQSRLASPRFPLLHEFASCFDYVTGMSLSFKIGQTDYFGLGFATMD